ncbi:MAG: hypothetical protein IJU07_06645 [Synergistaceae bacterium]|nr:hypothetical protein [Synergistaceae bacterium]
MNDVHQFLRDNPTETVILDVSCEYDDSASNWRVNPTLKKKLQKYDYLSHKDETGYPYELWIYAGEPGSASGNILPKLGEVRGKAVIISSQASSIGLGLQTGSSNGTGNFTLSGVNFAYENHYDVDAKTKSSAVRSFYDDNKIYITLGDWGHWDHILKGLVVYTSSNCAASLGNHPYTIAQTVNPEANSFWGTFKSQGLLAGWVGADFVGTSTSHNRAYDMNADAIWQVNFRNDYSGSSRRGSPYYFIIYENVAGNPIHSQEVLKGAALTLPQPPTYPVSAPNWIDVDTGEVLDGTILPDRDITLKANASYYSLQGQNEQQLVGAGTSGGCNAGVSSVIFAALLVIARKITKK